MIRKNIQDYLFLPVLLTSVNCSIANTFISYKKKISVSVFQIRLFREEVYISSAVRLIGIQQQIDRRKEGLSRIYQADLPVYQTGEIHQFDWDISADQD